MLQRLGERQHHCPGDSKGVVTEWEDGVKANCPRDVLPGQAHVPRSRGDGVGWTSSDESTHRDKRVSSQMTATKPPPSSMHTPAASVSVQMGFYLYICTLQRTLAYTTLFGLQNLLRWVMFVITPIYTYLNPRRCNPRPN